MFSGSDCGGWIGGDGDHGCGGDFESLIAFTEGEHLDGVSEAVDASGSDGGFRGDGEREGFDLLSIAGAKFQPCLIMTDGDGIGS
ncbi:MAG: hypothetical protein RL215_508 [Planctomycetota bacterium]